MWSRNIQIFVWKYSNMFSKTEYSNIRIFIGNPNGEHCLSKTTWQGNTTNKQTILAISPSFDEKY